MSVRCRQMSLARRDVISIKTPAFIANPAPDPRRALCAVDAITQRTLTGGESMIVVAGVSVVHIRARLKRLMPECGD
jgi:hypothetical protein